MPQSQSNNSSRKSVFLAPGAFPDSSSSGSSSNNSKSNVYNTPPDFRAGGSSKANSKSNSPKTSVHLTPPVGPRDTAHSRSQSNSSCHSDVSRGDGLYYLTPECKRKGGRHAKSYFPNQDKVGESFSSSSRSSERKSKSESGSQHQSLKAYLPPPKDFKLNEIPASKRKNASVSSPPPSPTPTAHSSNPKSKKSSPKTSEEDISKQDVDKVWLKQHELRSSQVSIHSNPEPYVRNDDEKFAQLRNLERRDYREKKSSGCGCGCVVM